MPDGLLAGGALIWETARGLLASHDKAKADLFNLHIEPLQQRMLVVHKDYVQAFIQIRDDLREGKMNASDVRNFLDRRCHDYLHERSAALALAQELAASERRPIRGDAWSAILAYCEAIENYLLTPYQLNWTSRYRRLLDMTADVDFNSNLMIFPTADASEQSRQVLDFSNVINDLLDKEMPCAIDELNFTCAKLRTLLL